ncbi:MAG TPA: FAD-binding oxidoreductase [Actinomycetota bacterium]|nr:FAD-binding oxidoreductase [Actinomycetota bacterium]
MAGPSSGLSLWLARHRHEPTAPLEGSARTDVVVLGGGFTGLWSAIHLKEADPALGVVLLEAEEVGYGASGRNGGFAMTMVGRSLHDLVRKVGVARARATYDAMVEALRSIEAFARAEGMEGAVVRTPILTVSNGPEQDGRIERDLEAARRLGLGSFRPLDAAACRELVGAEGVRRGHLEEHGLLVDPAALVRGLRDAAIRRGVRVFEGSPARAIRTGPRGVEVRTPAGEVRAERAVLALGAYGSSIPRVRRYLFTVYASIVVTEPLDEERWARVGWRGGLGIEDKRTMPHFFRPTPDGRILWGGRDAPYVPGGPDPRFDRIPWVYARLEETFRATFPQLADVRIERGWSGPIDATVMAMPHVTWLDGGRAVSVAGYSAHGVGPAHLVGEVVRDLVLDRRSGLLELPFVTAPRVPLPPEPFRRLVVATPQRVLQRADDAGGGGLAARFLTRILQ